jgi:ABC-type antimicrobial peptide transport system permease subunit
LKTGSNTHLALCIGATTSLFTVMRSVLLRPLPFRDPDRLVMIYEHFRDPSKNAQQFNYNSVAPADYYDWRAQTHGFEDIAVWRWWQYNVTGEHGELPELVSARAGSWNLFPLLGVQAAIGRTFTQSEDRTDGTAVMLTWNIFERRFGGDASIVGKQIHLDGKPYTVVGVLPRWFTYPDAKVQIWVPYASGMSPELLGYHDHHFSYVVARLRPDVSLANALSQVSAVQYRLHMQYLNDPVAEDVMSRTLSQDLAKDVTKPLIVLLGAVACMLLIGCLNVANLLVARSAARQKEISIRSALGAQRVTLTALRKTLLTIEIAATVVLLISAGLLLKSFWRLRTTDVGCVTENVLTMSYSLPAKKYDTPDKANAFNEGLLERVRTMPGVRAAGLGFLVPGAGPMGDDAFTIREHPAIPPGQELPVALYATADPGFFTTLQIPLLNGRFFTNDDRAGHPEAVIVSRQLAQQYLPGENPLGKHLHVGAVGDADYEIVGVVADTLYQVGKPSEATIYFPVLGGNPLGVTLVARTASDPLALSVPVQKQIAALDPEMPVRDVFTLRQIIERSLGNASLSASLVLAFAVLSLMLASVGLYGVLSYLTTQRTGEIGIRIALGAQRDQVMRLMLGDGMRPALYGLALGLATSAVAVRLVESMLYETQPLDPTIFMVVATTLLAVAALACMIPAWKASRIDPMQALRNE